MKKILFILCFLSVKAYAQEPTYVPMKSNYLFRGIKMDSLFLPPVYPDTATGTTKVNFAGSVIRVGSKLYMRNSSLTQWVDLSSAGGGGATDTTSLSNRINARLLISDTSSMLTNYQRTSSFPIAVFGAGSGAAGDTSAFSTTALYGSFYLNAGADTIIVTGYTGVVQGTSASVTPTIWFNDSMNVTAGATKIVNSPSAVTSTTTGNTVTSLDNTKIPPGNFVWVSTGTVTTKPTYFNLTLIGYRKR